MPQKYVEFRLASEDISTVRFGVSPGHEIVHAVRTLSRPQEQPLQWGWLRAVRGDVPRESLELLRLVVGEAGYAPDLFTSAPSWDLTPADEIARLREAPLEPIAVDLRKRAIRSAGVARAALERMAAEPERVRAMIVRHVEALWETALAPYWAQIERILHADIGSRVRRMTADGLAGMAADLGEAVEWSAATGFDTVRVRMERHEEVVDCHGRGLVLVPSFFGRHCAVLTEPPAQPTLFYPALGVSEAWHRADAADALAGLLGESRAAVLLTLGVPLSTTETAAEVGIAASTASHHLDALRAAGLIASRRAGRRVLHARTPLGDALVHRV